MVEAGCEPGRALCITVTKWMHGVKIRLQWQSGRTGGNVVWGYFEPYWLPTVGRDDQCWTGVLVYWFWICRWSVVWKLFWDSKTVLAIFVRYDMDICNKLSWLIVQIDSSNLFSCPKNCEWVYLKFSWPLIFQALLELCAILKVFICCRYPHNSSPDYLKLK